MNSKRKIQSYVYYIETAESYGEIMPNEELKWQTYKGRAKDGYITSPEKLVNFNNNLTKKLNFLSREKTSLENGFINIFSPKNYPEMKIYVKIQTILARIYEKMTGRIIKDKLNDFEFKPTKPGQ